MLHKNHKMMKPQDYFTCQLIYFKMSSHNNTCNWISSQTSMALRSVQLAFRLTWMMKTWCPDWGKSLKFLSKLYLACVGKELYRKIWSLYIALNSCSVASGTCDWMETTWIHPSLWMWSCASDTYVPSSSRKPRLLGRSVPRACAHTNTTNYMHTHSDTHTHTQTDVQQCTDTDKLVENMI